MFRETKNVIERIIRIFNNSLDDFEKDIERDKNFREEFDKSFEEMKKEVRENSNQLSEKGDDLMYKNVEQLRNEVVDEILLKKYIESIGVKQDLSDEWLRLVNKLDKEFSAGNITTFQFLREAITGLERIKRVPF